MRTRTYVSPTTRFFFNTLACLLAAAALVVAPKAHAVACGSDPDKQNGQPEAKIGGPATQTVAEASIVGGVRTPTTVQLNGNPSRGDTFAWTQTSGPSVTLVGATTDVASFTAPDVGPGGATLTFLLTASCNGTSDTEPTTVNITNVNSAPTATAGNDDIVLEGDLVTLTGAGNDPDGDRKSVV